MDNAKIRAKFLVVAEAAERLSVEIAPVLEERERVRREVNERVADLQRQIREAETPLREFEGAHRREFELLAALEEALRSPARAPAGLLLECQLEGPDGKDCPSISVRTGERLPEGWAERQHSCGCGPSGSFGCPGHSAEELEEFLAESDRCSDCSR